jgi:hypothetical protein
MSPRPAPPDKPTGVNADPPNAGVLNSDKSAA